MSVRDLIQWGRGHNDHSVANTRDGSQDPFLAFHREFDRLFDDFFQSFNSRLPAFAGSDTNSWPSVDISETDKEIKVSAELPGLEEKDVEVLLDNGVLTLRGDKTAENEDKEKQFTERFYGHFERRIPLGVEVEEDKIDAKFKNGVLKITLPKSERAQQQVKRIAITH